MAVSLFQANRVFWFESISKSFGNRRLFSNLSLKATSGLILVKGRSGCGKTTLFRILTGIERPDSGEVSMGPFAYCGQDNTLLPKYSLRKNMKSLLGLKFDEKASELCRLLSFERYVDAPIISLSGGERQKAEIVFCLSQDRPIYFFDEPFSSLDEDSRDKVASLISGLSAHRLVFLINHDVKIEGLSPDCLIEFSAPGEAKAEVVGPLDRENSFRPVQRTKGSFARAIALAFYRFANAPIYSSMRVFLAFASVCLFALFCAFAPLGGRAQSYASALSSDPFSAHLAYLSSGDGEEGVVSDPNGFSTYLIENSLVRLEGDGIELYGVLDEGEEAVCYSSFGNQGLIKDSDGHISINGETEVPIRHVKVSNNEVPSDVPAIFDIYDYFYDSRYEDTEMLLVSRSFAMDLLKLGSSSLYSSNGVIECGFSYPSFAHSPSGYFELSYTADRDISVTDGSGYSLRLGEKEYESQFKGDKGYARLPVLGLTPGVGIEFSFGAYLAAISISLDNQTLYFDSDSALGLFDFGDVRIVDLISDSRSNWNYHFWFLGFSIISLVAYLLLVSISSFGDDSISKVTYQIERHIGRSSVNFYVSAAIFGFLEILLPTLIGLAIYGLCLIPVSNFTNMVYTYGVRRPVGYYYYSLQPSNPFYDSILSPVPFADFQPLSLVLLCFGLLMFMASVLSFLLSCRRNGKRLKDPFYKEAISDEANKHHD